MRPGAESSAFGGPLQWLETVGCGQVLRFPRLARAGCPNLITTRLGLDPRQVRHALPEVIPVVLASLGGRGAAWLKQVHGDQVRRAAGAGPQGTGDALWTDRPDLALVAKSGDCPIVLIYEPVARLAGFAHASWRSTVAGIVPALVRRMVEAGGRPERMTAAVAPSVGPECYEVGPEVRDQALRRIGPHARAYFRPSAADHWFFDLWQANRQALVGCGLPPEHVDVAGVCTVCHGNWFPSHRREGPDAGRFVVALCLDRTDGDADRGARS